MCTLVRVGNSDLLETVGDLAEALGIEHSAISEHGPDNCLCGVEFEAVALAANRTVRNCVDDPGYPWPEYIFE